MGKHVVKAKLSYNDIKKMQKKFELAAKSEKRLREEFIKRSLNYLEQRARYYIRASTGNSEWYSLTHNLENSFHKEVDRGMLINEAYYSAFVNFGTGIYGVSKDGYKADASGKGAKGWHFKYDGKTYFTHGIKPHYFIEHAIADYCSNCGTIFEKSFDKVLGGILK